MNDEANAAFNAPAPRVSEGRLLEIALKMAAHAGERSPTLVQYS
jgi:hypothetical protein